MHVVAQLIGYPRIGPNRELKWTLEKAWSGRSTPAEFASRIAELRAGHLAEQRELIGSAVDDFFLYDEVLETALMLGVHPAGLGGEPFDLLTALARGTAQREAWEMTKWFDTNYHYVVPELEALPERLTPSPMAGADRRHRLADPGSLQLRPAEQASRPGCDRAGSCRGSGDRRLGPFAAERVPAPARRAEPRHAA